MPDFPYSKQGLSHHTATSLAKNVFLAPRIPVILAQPRGAGIMPHVAGLLCRSGRQKKLVHHSLTPVHIIETSKIHRSKPRLSISRATWATVAPAAPTPPRDGPSCRLLLRHSMPG